MQHHAVPITGVIGYADVVTTEKDGVIYVAEESNDSYVEFPDWCFPNAIKLATNGYGEIRPEVVEHCQYCDSDSPELKRVMDAWDAVLLNEDPLGDPVDYHEELEKILDTANYVVADDHYLGYKAMPGGSFELRAGQYLIFGCEGATVEDIMPYASAIVAHLNGCLWDVGTISADDVDDITELQVHDCENVCGGFVWDNVDSDGMSTPTAEELTNCL